ncbi:kelch-like protein 3 isoform X2 [Acyrthosiphon pisum]|nr:kelch-like protein 3 isoform X2 [Acyrthosiphon pisum]XP_003243303.1 kelch-like protein 3 isoform X2 [Acyrthosiphon pisum]|eukprot:XP_001948815.2 PREDICTED: kelch-like protein 3 isoform X2 [Acyrthosiphon pisum]
MQNLKQIPVSSSCEPSKYEYKKSSYTEMFKVLHSLRQDEVFCDIKLEADDGKIIFGHKVVLASASPYFHAMFTNFAESNKDLVAIKHLNSTAIQLLVDYIYSGEVVVTEKNVQILLPAANLLQLQEIKEACCDFLRTQLHHTNCFGINALADLYSCMELLKSSELYTQQHFSEVVEGDEFLSLSSEQVIKLISSDKLIIPSEEKVFESVIRWVKHELDSRKCILPQLMEHVRLPLTSKNFIVENVVKEPLLNNCPKCKDYIIEALQFHLLKSAEDLISIPQNIRTKPRHARSSHKVIFVVGGQGAKAIGSTEWYDPQINRWQIGPEMITRRCRGGVAVLKDNFVFAVGGVFKTLHQSVDVLDLTSESPCWKPTADMLVKRKELGVGVIKDCLYAVGGFDGTSCLNSTEVFDCKTQKWCMVSSMSTRRSGFGVGVLNDVLYVVGGYDSSRQSLNTVECYHPSFDTWTSVADLCVRRSGVGVGVLDGVLYAVGGYDGLEVRSSVEVYRPASTRVWTTIADMNLCRRNAGVVALDGLLYVVGGRDGISNLDSVEFYNPITNTWSMLEASMHVARYFAGVVAINM